MNFFIPLFFLVFPLFGKTLKTIELTPNNVLTIKDTIDEASASNFIYDLNKYQNKDGQFLLFTIQNIKLIIKLDQKLIDIYNDFIKDDDQDIFTPPGKTKVTNEMGLIGKVSDARIKLENIYNMKKLPPTSDPKEPE